MVSIEIRIYIYIHTSYYIDTEKYHESVTVYCAHAAGLSAIHCN